MSEIFQTQVENEPSFLSYLAQQLAVPLVPWLLALIVVAAVSRLTEVPGLPQQDNWPLSFFICCASGFGCGFLVARWIPKARPMGKWVFVLPVLGFAIVFCGNWWDRGFERNFSDLFTDLLGILVTAPTVCAVFYSLGVRAGSRR